MRKYNLQQPAFENEIYVGATDYLYNDRDRRRFRTRYIIIGVVVVVCVAAISIGLGVGLTKSSSDKHPESSAVKGYSHYNATTPSTVKAPSTSQYPQSTSKSTKQSQSSVTSTPPVDELCIDQRENKTCPWKDMPLVLVSLDGFRAEYVLRNLTPVIQRLRRCGVHTPYMRAVYPTLTFPNHYTIVTGLYPESHGIVGNSMYDPVFNASFSLRGQEKFNPRWWKGEPLWTTAKKQGKKTASYFWVGSDVNSSDMNPDIWHTYNNSVPYETRVQSVLDWLMLPDGERPDFTTLYFDEPDHTGHGDGPDSPEVNAMLKKIDDVIGLLINGLKERQIDHCVNLIILADHGMAPTSCARQVALSPYIKADKLLIFDGTTGHINTQFHRDSRYVYKTEEAMSTEEVLDRIECKDVHLNAYTSDTIPKRHHYTNNRRIGQVVLDIESDWLVYAKKSRSCLAGNHGFDNIYKSMHALFLGHGPGFKENYEAEPFENIELYNLMSELLGIEPAPNNGTRYSLHHMLRTNKPVPDFTNQSKYGQCQSSTSRTSTTSCQCPHMSMSTPPTETKFPLGEPVPVSQMSTCLLPGRWLTTAYSLQYKMPLWASFSLTEEEIGLTTIDTNASVCVISDTRLSDENNPKCSVYQNSQSNLSLHHLLPPGLTTNKNDQAEAHLSSSVVPMYNGFATGIWKFTWMLVQQYIQLYGEIHLTVGPVFDYNGDGLSESPNNDTRFVDDTETIAIPSHFFLSMAKCRDVSVTISKCRVDKLDILSFVLPHQQQTHNCMPHKDFIRTHVARIKDIEELVGVRFLTRFSRADGARLRTYLPTELWSADAVTPWEQRPCNDGNSKTCPAGPKPLLLVSLDGFRADYMKRNLSPTLQRLSNCGVHTPYMRATYPTVTFPNHYTIVTGLYPESHGIVSNTMYDEDIDAIFKISRSKDPRWWKGEPLWTTAQNQGLRTATYFWPGSDVNISGVYPDIYKRYDGSVGYTERLYEVLDWITMPEDTRPHFITLYFDQPDHAGHNAGPESAEVDGQVETVDALMNRLMSSLYERNVEHCVDIIILADHGFADQTCAKTVELADFYKNITSMLVFERVMGQVFPQFVKKSSRDVDRLNTAFPVQPIVDSLMCKSEGMKVFTKSTLPKRHHYTNSDRIADILLDMKESWLVFEDKAYFCNGGNHGWDNIIKHMHALFMAYGPSFKKNFRAEPFENIELYNLMSEILGITPAPNNGTLGSLDYLLQTPTAHPSPQLANSSMCSYQETNTFHPGCQCHNESTNPLPALLKSSAGGFVVPVFVESSFSGDDVCVLYNNGSVTGYSRTVDLPVWNTLVLRNTTAKNLSKTSCIYKDSRTSSDVCTRFKPNISMSSLNLVGTTVGRVSIHLESQSVPMYEGFRVGVWSYLWDLISDYVHLYGEVSVTAGALFDYNTDGLWEGITTETVYADVNESVPMPSHIYVILTKCKDPSASLPCNGIVDTMSFILPNLQEVPNCLRYPEYLKDNVARIKDIELLSGLRFMTSMNVTFGARLRTYLVEDLWYTNLIRQWKDLPCPNKDMCTSDYKPVLLISLDGFRADYLLRNVTPIIGRLNQCGVRAPYMRSVYPTKTFPNHYSIVTGLYPESHGIIDNNMYDPSIGDRFSLSSPNASDPRWWGGEPIWITAKKQGLRTATYFWPGSDVKIQGEYPDIWKKYDGSISYSSRVSDVLSWMALPRGERPDFITLYFDEPDLSGHKYGPSNEAQIGATLERVDETIGQLMDGLVDQKLHHCVNIIIIADHGMADVSCRRLVRLSDYLDQDYMSDNLYVWEGPFGRIATDYKYHNRTIITNPNPVADDEFLGNITCRSPHLHVYNKNDLPVRHHYTNNPRIDDIILDVDDSWLVTRHWANLCRGGNHGYDNIYKSMQALFLAYGPAFHWNLTIEPFENIELYNLFAEILNITAAPNNGTVGSLNAILQNPPSIPQVRVNVSYQNVTLQQSVGKFLQTVKSSSCLQFCTNASDLQLTALYSSLKTMNSNMPNHHVPWGIPVQTGARNMSSLTLLDQPSSIVGYDGQLDMPIWLSHTVSSRQIQSVSSSNSSIGCVIPDVRVMDQASDTSHMCPAATNDVHWTSLMLGGLQTNQQLLPFLSSSLVPMKSGFIDGILKNITGLLQNWVKEFTTVNIVTGPVFDHNHDGLADSTDNQLMYTNITEVLPSHYFFIATRCLTGSTDLSSCSSLDTASYIIPHTDIPTSCKNFTDYMTDNEARVRDVELVTGLQFFPNLPILQAVQLRTRLPQGIW